MAKGQQGLRLVDQCHPLVRDQDLLVLGHRKPVLLDHSVQFVQRRRADHGDPRGCATAHHDDLSVAPLLRASIPVLINHDRQAGAFGEIPDLVGHGGLSPFGLSDLLFCEKFQMSHVVCWHFG